MEQPAVEIARRYLEALHDEDVDAAYALLAPDVEVVSPRRTIKGADEVRARWTKAEYDNLLAEVERRDYQEQNGRVLATTHMLWRWRESGDPAYRTRVEGAFEIRDGKIARIETNVQHGPA